MLWRPFAFVSSLAVAALTTLISWVYLSLAHNLSWFIETWLLMIVFAGLWWLSSKYLQSAGSIARVRERLRSTAKAIIAATVLLLGVGIADLVGIGEGPDTVLNCEDCSTISVTRVIDGDTLVSGGERIRLFGIDAPEVGQQCASGATDRLVALARDRVRVEDGPRRTDMFGRRLFYLYTDDGRSIDELMVGEGHAIAWDRDGQHRDYLVDLERSVRSEGVGCLW
jgi:endonuclease YncB( thermonuclease family)